MLPKRILAAVVFALVLGASALAWAAIDVPSVGVDEAKEPELIETVDITKRGAPRTVLSLKDEKLSFGAPGQTIEAFAEVEVSVTCMEPMPKCVGTIYRYSPKVQAQFVLADGEGRTGKPIGEPVKVTCSQDLPARNHHCVLYMHRTATLTGIPACAPTCNLNVVLKAYHDNAKPGNKLVIGADTDDYIQQGKAAISAAVFSQPPLQHAPRKYVTSQRLVERVTIKESDTEEVGVASIRLDNLRRGEVLVAEGRAISDVGHLEYGVLSQGSLVLSEKKGSSDNHGIPISVGTNNGKFATENGFNCTQKDSGFQSPCAIRKGGAMRILAPSRENPNQDSGNWVPLWVNLYVSFGEEYNWGKGWQPSDTTKIRDVELVVRRYSPTQLP